MAYMVLSFFIVTVESFLNPAGAPTSNIEPDQRQEVVASPFLLKESMQDLERNIREVCAKPRLRTGVFVVEPESARYCAVDAHEKYCTASMIKMPILVALMVALDEKRITRDQWLTIRQDLIGGGSGYLQWRPLGSKVSVSDAAGLMITHSDNTATNLILDAIGGKETFNRLCAEWGMRCTFVANLLPDLEGTNKTSPYDLSLLLGKIERGELISADNRKWMYDLMFRCRTRTLLPMGLGAGARVAHKTGDIGCMVGDAGIVFAPNGKKYIVAIQVERPHNDGRANELIRRISALIYEKLTGLPGASFSQGKTGIYGRTHRRGGKRHS